MKAILFNGSPREGNTCTALNALRKGLEHISDLEIQEIKAADVNVSPCIACDTCGSNSHCVADDDTNDIIDAVVEADILIFATPVYWWGVTAQLKSIIDKFYSQAEKLHTKKKVGTIIIGEAEQNDPQYQLIPKQFACICDYLGWDVAFSATYTALNTDDLAKSADALKEIEELWKTL